MNQNAEGNPPGPTIRAYLEADEAEVVALWTACGLVRPWYDPRKDIARKVGSSATCFWSPAPGPAIASSPP